MTISKDLEIRNSLAQVVIKSETCGTAFFVGPGYLITAYHVIKDIPVQQIVIVSSFNNSEYPIEKVEDFVELDTSIIRINDQSIPALPLADASDIAVGDRCWIYGFQLSSRLNSQPYLADGVISAFDSKDLLVLDASLLPGMSGAPIFDLHSRKVIGLIRAKITGDSGNLVTHSGISVPILAVYQKCPWLHPLNLDSFSKKLIDLNNHFKQDLVRLLKDDLHANVETDYVSDGIIIDIVAGFSFIGKSHNTAIFCVSYDIDKDSIYTFGSTVSLLRQRGEVDDGRIISEADIPQDVKTWISKFPSITCITRRDLENEVLGINNYIDRLIYDYEHYDQIIRGDHLPVIPEMTSYNAKRYYVDLNATDNQGNKYTPIDSFFNDWVNEEQNNLVSVVINDDRKGQVSILGDAGSGKTTFCLHLAYAFACKWKRGEINRVPIYIPLKGYSPEIGIDGLITRVVKDVYKLQLSASNLLRHATEVGRFLLIFDGLDEMAAYVVSEDEVQKRLDEIRSYARSKGKVILTCRSNYFKIEEQIDNGSEVEVAIGLIKHSKRKQIRVLNIDQLDEKQIIEFLTRHPQISYRGPEWWSKAQKISNMRTLAERPLLLRMLVDAVPSIETFSANTISIAELYAIFIHKLLSRDKETGRSLVLTPVERFGILKAFALDNLITGTNDIFMENLPFYSKQLYKLFLQKGRPDWVEYDIRNTPLLHRKGNAYSFIHSSFKEFLAAYEIAEFLIDKNISEFHCNAPIDVYRSVISESVRRYIVGVIGLFIENGYFSYPLHEYTQTPLGTHSTMVLLPNGSFISGNYDTKLEIRVVENPYFISKYPVVWNEYEVFQPNKRRSMGISADPNAPVTGISWEEALSYCDWLSSKSDNKRYRLPTEDEWEKASRGIDGRLYPWGDDEPTGKMANWGNIHTNTTPVDYFPSSISPYGLFDTVGNAYEFTSTTEDNGVSYICRGGSWQEYANRIRCSSRRTVKFNTCFLDVGFRLAMNA